jgi:hypothetical protein
VLVIHQHSKHKIKTRSFAITADSTHIRAVWSVLGSEVRLIEPRFSIEDRHVI